jgi:hypothetical protein
MNYIEEKYPNEDYSKYEGKASWNTYLDYAGGNKQFALWLAFTDVRVQKITGGAASLFDLEDFMSFDAFDSGSTPLESAREALANDSLFCVFA